MTRVLMLSHEHPSLIAGGSGMLARDLARALNVAGSWRAMLVAATTTHHRAPRAHTPFQAVGRTADEMLLHVASFERFLFSNESAAAIAPHVHRLLQTFAPDIVHLHHLDLIGVEMLGLVRRFRPQARIVMTLHDFHPICANDGLMITRPEGALCHRASADSCHACFPEIAPERFVLRATHLRNMLSLVDRFIAPSRFLRDRYVSWGIVADRIDVVANALPEMIAPPAQIRQTAKPSVFGFFGNLAPHKGILIALDAIRRAAAEVPELRLRVHGAAQFQSESFRAAIDAALAAASPAVSAHGAYRREDLPVLLSAVDWVVVPSSWWENAPLVVLEAFRHRRPVIAADVGGMAELVTDGGNGLLFRCGDAEDLARVLRRAATEEGLWRRLSDAAPVVADIAHSAARHAQIYDDLLGTQQRMSA